MKPNEFLAFHAIGGSCVIETRLPADQIWIIGASMPMSANPGDHVHSFTIQRGGKDKGVVVVQIFHCWNPAKSETGSLYRILFLEVDWNRPSPINPENQWVSLPDRMCQDHHVGWLIVKTPTKVYSTIRANLADAIVVPDANLLCRFMTGEATEEQLEAAAQEYVVEQTTAEKLRQVEADLSATRTTLHQAFSDAGTWQNRYNCLASVVMSRWTTRQARQLIAKTGKSRAN